MEWPVGDFLRKLVAPDSFLGKILQLVRGIRISRGDTTIVLTENPGIPKSGEFNKPHQPGPIR